MVLFEVKAEEYMLRERGRGSWVVLILKDILNVIHLLFMQTICMQIKSKLKSYIKTQC
jgi:hypothetical protein